MEGKALENEWLKFVFGRLQLRAVFELFIDELISSELYLNHS